MKPFICLLACIALAAETNAQTPLTKEQILNMSTEELSELPLEDLMQAVETLGVGSVDELFALIMNKNVSSASKTEESTFTSQLATTVITKDELRSWGATTIEDAFRLVPGMIVSQRNNGDYDIHIRGLNNVPENQLLLYTNNNNMQLMVDGRSVQNLITGIIQMDQLPISIEDVERIEVVRGACSALYGMNAVTGIINIITEKPAARSKTVSGCAQMGNRDTYIADFTLRQAVSDRLAFGITANAQTRGRNTDKLYVAAANDLYYDVQGAYAVGAIPSEADKADPDKLRDVSGGGYFAVDEINNIRQLDTRGRLMLINETDAPIEGMFPEPGLARRNFGINGYVSFTPKADLRVDLTGGYQNSYALNLSPSQDFFTEVGTDSKTGYVNLEANAGGLRILANYTGGPQNFVKGVAGFKLKANIFNAEAEYDFNVGDFNIRPGVAYNYMYYKDYPEVSKSHAPEEIGFLGGSADINVVSPSLRAQWRLGGLSVTGAVRADKTSKPDKWNTSYLAAASYEINDANFVRLSFGHAFRGPNMINTGVDQTWYRTGLIVPSMMYFKGSSEADLMNLDNVEFGYRWKPTPRVLLDAEVFLSRSQDYGAVMTSKSAYTISESMFSGVKSSMTADPEQMKQLIALRQTDPAAFQQKMTEISQTMITSLMGTMDTYTQMEYQNLPYKVYQMGLSLNLDWIVSSKLIVKLNANVQSTKVDNFFVYSQNANVGGQIASATQTTLAAVTELVQGEMHKTGYAGDAFNFADFYGFRDAVNWNSWTDAQRQDVENQLLQSYSSNGNADATVSISSDASPVASRTVKNPLSMYYAMKYGVLRRKTAGEDYYDCGTTETQDPELSDGHKHKATPAVYGMVGLIYKPTSQWNIAAYGNYVGKRVYNTTYSQSVAEYGNTRSENTDLDPKFTLNLKVGYKPSDNVEFFFNANNLFNNDKREMIYCDKIGGLYTVGVNFAM